MLKIAWRNILRNKRRSFLTLSIMVSSVAILFLVLAYISSLYWALDITAVAQNGHLQIAKPSFWDTSQEERDLLSQDEMDIISGILNQEEAVVDTTTELDVNGILGTENKSIIVSGQGIVPGSSQTQNILMQSGENLLPGDQDKILVGDGIRESLNLKENEWVSILATTPDGAYNAGSLQVAGSFTTGYEEYDAYMVFLPINFAKNLLFTDGVDKIIVTLNDTEMTLPVTSWLRERFEENNLNVKIKTWIDLSKFFQDLKNWYDLIFFFLSTLIFILVFLGVLEIMTMSFFERMNEIGMMRAIGTKRGQVFFILIAEAVLLSILGVVIGVLVGCGVGYVINNMNITYFPPGGTQAVPLILDLALKNSIIPLFIILFSTLLSALYPAVKSSRLNIVKILRHV